MDLSHTNQQHRPAIPGMEEQEAGVEGWLSCFLSKFTQRATEPTLLTVVYPDYTHTRSW